MRNSRLWMWFFVLTACMLWAVWNIPVFADGGIERAQRTTADDTNYAQDQHAVNVAERATLQDPGVASLKEYLEHAEDAFKKAEESHNEDEIEAARAAYESAQSRFDAAFSEIYDGKRAEIDTLRSGGLGWGAIAHKIGVHPGILGLGHAKHQDRYEKKYQASKQRGIETQSTARNSMNTQGGKHAGYGHGKDRGGKSSRGGGHGGGKK